MTVKIGNKVYTKNLWGHFVSFLYRPDMLGKSPSGISKRMLKLVGGLKFQYQIPTVQALYRNMQKPGSGQAESLDAEATIQPAAGNYSKVEDLRDMSAALSGLDPGVPGSRVVIDSYINHMRFESSKPFLICAFLAKLQNGESIPATDFDTFVDAYSAINTAVSDGLAEIKISEIAAAVPFRDNGTKYWRAELLLDLTTECQRYINEYYKEVIDEDSAPNPFRFGLYVQCDTVNTAVTYTQRKIIDYHQKEAKISFSF
jgi:hypothetical protein